MKPRICFTLLPYTLTLFISLSAVCQNTNANNLIPSSNSDFYYKLGGGNSVPLPAFYDTSYIPLNAEADVGLGFDCGVFNPIASLTNSLNQIKQSFLAVQQQVLDSATGAITELPLYELSRADPSLYNLITNAIAGAQKDIELSTKSCQVMQSQIAAGENPYAHWMNLSMGNKWRTEIGTAMFSGNGDINQAKNTVDQDAGKNGIPWVTGTKKASGTTYAGGMDQPPIQVINDTSIAGYKVITKDADHAFGNKSNQLLGDTESELAKTWASPEDAAAWITNVVGDKTVTTYNGGKKDSKPGAGLYPDIQYQMDQLKPKLQALVTGATPLTVENLQAVSPEGIALSPQIIQSIQNQPKILQAIIVDKLAQNIAAINVIEKVRLATRLLQAGGQEPAIYSNKAAKQSIQEAMSLLQQDVSRLMFYVKAKQELASNILSTITQEGQAQTLQNTSINIPKPNEPMMEQGAIKTHS